MSEILKSWLGKIYAWAVPSALALGAGWLVIISQVHTFNFALEALSSKTGSPIFLTAVITLSICLYAVQTPMYRILEGYLFWPKWLQDRGEKKELARKKLLIESANGQVGWRLGLALERLGRLPLRKRQILPTRFGNAIRSFETYGKTRFNLDSQILWHELCAVAPKSIPSEIDDARSSVDFFVASIYLSAGLTVVLLVSAIWLGSVPALFALVSLCVVGFSHWMAVRSTDAWSSAVQALVNVGRVKLAASLGLRLPETLEDERRMWGIVTRFVLQGNKDDGLALGPFRLRAPIPPLSPTGVVATAAEAEAEPDPDEDDHGDAEENEDGNLRAAPDSAAVVGEQVARATEQHQTEIVG